MIGPMWVLPTFAANPECLFLPLQLSRDSNRQFLEWYAWLKKTEYFGLLLIFCHLSIRLAGVFD